VDVETPLPDGPYTATATGRDPAGNTGTATDPGSVDTTPPELTVNAPDNSTDDTPTISGTTDLPPGSTVTVTVTDSGGNQQTLTATVKPDGTYSVDVKTPLPDGPYTATATGKDSAGNTSSTSDPGSVAVSDSNIGAVIQLANPTPPLFPPSSGGAYWLLPFREPNTSGYGPDYHPSQLSRWGNTVDCDLYLTGSLRNQVVLELQNYSFSIPPNVFRHTNPNEQLEYEATELDGSPLPNWLHFDPKTLRFSGMPPKGAKNTEVMVTAKDHCGKKAFATFRVIVNKDNKEITNSYTKPKIKPAMKVTHAEINKELEQPVMLSKLGFSEQLSNAGKLSRLMESRALLDSLNRL
jgi:Bacterial Ig-like domain/Putative Ig domain